MWLSGILRPGHEVSWLNVPFTDHPAGATEEQTTVEGLGNLGFAVNTIHVIANNNFLNANPAAHKWFELVKISNADISAQNHKVYEGENSEEDIQRHVDEWIAANQADWGRVARGGEAGGHVAPPPAPGLRHQAAPRRRIGAPDALRPAPPFSSAAAISAPATRSPARAPPSPPCSSPSRAR